MTLEKEGTIAVGRVIESGPGPFVTHQLQRLADGYHLVAHSRRHRKGLRPHRVREASRAKRLPSLEASAFRHLWAPGYLGWWIAILFMSGSLLFTVGGLGGAWPTALPGTLTEGASLARLFVVGALFFTAAAWLQWLEVLNRDISEALVPGMGTAWRWVGWRPRNLGYLACTVQLAGTLLFNLSTIAATRSDLSVGQQEHWIWTPNMLGCVCFLVASYLVYAEVSHGVASFAIRSLSWWIAVLNLSGSVAFQLSALFSDVASSPVAESSIFWSNLCTLSGGSCFLIGAYLLIPELFDEVPNERSLAPYSGTEAKHAASEDDDRRDQTQNSPDG